jgi:hypothetical protein
MTFKTVQYTTMPLGGSIGLLDLAIFVAAPGLIAQLVIGDTTTTVVVAVSGFFLLAVAKAIQRHLSSKRSFKAAKQHLAQHGVSVDLEFSQQLAVDSSSGKIVFVAPAAMSYQIYDRNDFLDCAHQWVSTSGPNGQLTRTQNILVFKTRNPQQPLYKIRMINHATAELWLARINAVLNS